jgi:hypothetical protein
MGTIIGWLVGKKLFGTVLGEKAARAIAYIALAAVLIGGFFAGKAIYDRSVIAHHDAAQQLDQAKRERSADANLHAQQGRDSAAAEQRTQEIDHATTGIPDQAPSARQHARACLELRRQAKAHNRPSPAC